MPPKIVVVGSFNADLVMYMPELPQMGETVLGNRFVTGPGGKGSNQAVGAARLGAEVTMISCVGNDSYGQSGLQLWRQEGIQTEYVVQDTNHATGIASIFVEDSGEDMIVIAAGANNMLRPEHVDAAANVIAGADVLLTQFEIPRETVLHALSIARQHNVTTILNPAPVSAPVPEEMLMLVDYITPNETEVEYLTGHKGDTAKTVAEHLLIREGQTGVVTMGAWGAIWVQKEKEGHIPAYIVEAVDAVAGGDAFNAGMAVGLGEGKSLEEVLRFANATAALAVTRKGAAESMPKREEVDAFIVQHADEE